MGVYRVRRNRKMDGFTAVIKILLASILMGMIVLMFVSVGLPSSPTPQATAVYRPSPTRPAVPTPTPTPTAVAQTIESMMAARYNGVIRYCPVGEWTQAQLTDLDDGLNRWFEAGINARFAASALPECDTIIYLQAIAGICGVASVGPGEIVLNPYDAGCTVTLSAWHEGGHNLYLDHATTGIMQPVIENSEFSDEELAAAAAIWGWRETK